MRLASRSFPRRSVPSSGLGLLRLSALAVALALPASAVAQDGPQGTTPRTQTGPVARPGARITLNGTYTIQQLIDFFADRFERTILLDDPRALADTVQFIGRSTLTFGEARQAMFAALESKGYSTYDISGVTHIVKNAEAAQSPIRVGEGADIPFTASYVTQIIPLDNVAVSDVNSVVTTLSSADAKVIAYAPTNTLIITDSAYNLRRVYDVLTRLDIASPSSRLEILPLAHAQASEVASIIEQIYGTSGTASGDAAATAAATRRESAAARRRRRNQPATPTASGGGSSVTAGKAGSFISKVLSDERTNSLIVLANDEGQAKILELVARLDVDVDLSSRSQIHVVYLENAKADEVATVLANLSQGGNQSQAPRANRSPAQTVRRPGAPAAAAGAAEESTGGVLAAFDSGMRITSDENTNSLVIIASNDDFQIVQSVIDQLDVRRKQVFVDAVILEMGSDDNSQVGIGLHGPSPIVPGANTDSPGFGLMSAQLGASSVGLTQDLLSGIAVGVFGRAISVPVTIGATTTDLSIPAFGVVLSALKSNSMVHVVSSPSLTTLDNQEAEITVGRRVPFPTTSGLNNLGQPVVSYQREDVATTLKITPRINSSNQVTLELSMEVSEIEEDNSGLDVNQAGFITSKREISTTALVGNNQTMVVGGLVGSTETEVETKIPILGDLPLIGNLFRGRRKRARRTNLVLFITPHIINSDEDMAEVMRVKAAQRSEFMRRFYGKSVEEQAHELDDLLRYSMNVDGQESPYLRAMTGLHDEHPSDGPTPDDDGAGPTALDAATQEEIQLALPVPAPRVSPRVSPAPAEAP